jgi:spore germination protein GerM
MKNDSFPTQDQYLSAFLVSCGVPIVAHERSNRSTFWFMNSEKNKSLSEKYYSRTAKVEPNAFSRALHKELTAMRGPDFTTPTTTGYTTDVKRTQGSTRA